MSSDGVILSVDPWAKSPTGVQLILPAHFWVYYALQWVDPHASHLQVNLYAACFQVYYALQRVDLYSAYSQVNLYAACFRVYCTLDPYAAHLWMNPYAGICK
jgi:hypothetical protein